MLALPFLALALLALLRLTTSPDPRGYGTHEQLGFGPCAFRDWFGGPCPTCGVTTAASHLVRGDLAAAWTTQPFAPLAALATAIAAVTFVRLHRRGADLGALALRHGAPFWTAVAVVLLLCWLA
ncbi:MAG: DUF2752 domain-containing protein [Planctomycetota bacterium]